MHKTPLQPIQINPSTAGLVIMAVAFTATGAAWRFTAAPHTPWAMVCIAVEIAGAVCIGTAITAVYGEQRRSALKKEVYELKEEVAELKAQVAESAEITTELLHSNRALADDLRTLTAQIGASTPGRRSPAGRTGDTGGQRIFRHG